jgi:quercetin dioxygenase-like cupin family protein
MFPCDVPDETPGGKTGIHVVPPPVAGGALSTASTAEALAAVAPYRLQTRRIALDRINLAPGAAFSGDTRTVGETAVTVLRGAARLQDRDAGQSADGATGAWWYIEAGSLWSVENPAADTTAELLLVRCVPPSID